MANVVSFIRASWGNDDAPVSAADVANWRTDDHRTTSADGLGQTLGHGQPETREAGQ